LYSRQFVLCIPANSSCVLCIPASSFLYSHHNVVDVLENICINCIYFFLNFYKVLAIDVVQPCKKLANDS